MRLLGLHVLAPLEEHGPSTRAWIIHWVAELKSAHWKRPNDVQNQFPRVVHDDAGLYRFPVAGLAIFVHVHVSFLRGIALIKCLGGER